MPINYWNHLDHECFYHIYNRAVGKELLFRDKTDYQFFLKKYKDCFNPYFDTYAYCLIPNHFHLIIRVKPLAVISEFVEKETTVAAQKYGNGDIDFDAFLSDQFRRLFSGFAMRYNARYKRRGPLFQERVKRVWINNEDRLKYLIAYVHHNPIHHKVRPIYTDWRYSSFNGLLSDGQSLLPREAVYSLFGDKTKFLKFHEIFKSMKFEEEIDS